jgi:hypothetical protein
MEFPQKIQSKNFTVCTNSSSFCVFLSSSLLSHTWELAPASEHRAEFPQFLNLGQSVGLLGRVISSSQGLYLYTNTEKPAHIHKH